MKNARRWREVSALASLLVVSACNGNRFHFWYGRDATPLGGSAMCQPVQSFFQANTYNSFSGQANIAIVGGADLSYLNSVAYPRLVNDESNRMMAVAASACEAFERGVIDEERYGRILDASLNTGFAQPHAALLAPEQLAEVMNGLREAVRQEAAAAAASSSTSVRAAAERLSQIADRLPVEGPSFQDLVAQGVADRAHLDQLLARMSSTLSENQTALIAGLNESERRELAMLQQLAELRASSARLEASILSAAAARPTQIATIDQTDIFFMTDSAKVEPIFVRSLRSRVESLQRRYPGATITARVEGFADTRGDPEANLNLSQQRAEAVAVILTGMGVRTTVEAQGEIDLFGEGLESNRVARATFALAAE